MKLLGLKGCVKRMLCEKNVKRKSVKRNVKRKKRRLRKENVV